MDNLKKNSTKKPILVRISLWGSSSRRMVLLWMWLSVLAALAFVVLKNWPVGLLFLLAALAYWYSIRWVDKNGQWATQADNSKAGKFWIIVACLIPVAAILAKTFFIGYYIIPQNGMYPSLPAHSTLFTAQHPYSGASGVKRGDIVAFLRNENGQTYTYIWRVIALPSETVEASGETLSINGQVAVRQLLEEKEGKRIFREKIGGVAYDIALDPSPDHNTPPVSITVPPDQFFVMGDNRFDARDSRYFGPISFNSIIGKKL